LLICNEPDEAGIRGTNTLYKLLLFLSILLSGEE
jgi:hypothetical protein